MHATATLAMPAFRLGLLVLLGAGCAALPQAGGKTKTRGLEMPLKLTSCTGAANQQFGYRNEDDGNETGIALTGIQSLGFCLDVYHSGTKAGTDVLGWPCSYGGPPSQFWFVRGQTIASKQARTPLCLGIVDGAGALADCTAPEAQFSIGLTPEAPGTIVHRGTGSCLTMFGPVPPVPPSPPFPPPPPAPPSCPTSPPAKPPAGPPPAGATPCEIYASGGTPCVAAHRYVQRPGPMVPGYTRRGRTRRELGGPRVSWCPPWPYWCLGAAAGARERCDPSTYPHRMPRLSPCHAVAAARTDHPAAHSMVRALYTGYAGALYVVRRNSDNATKSVGLLAKGGYADSAQQDAFCAGTDCTVTRIVDQSPNGNHLDVFPQGWNGHPTPEDSGVNASRDRHTVGGHPVYSAWFEPGDGYRNDGTVGVAVGEEPESMYMVTSGKHYDDQCCTRHEPFNSTPIGFNSISFGSPHAFPMGRNVTCR